jgi:hypothetical protein
MNIIPSPRTFLVLTLAFVITASLFLSGSGIFAGSHTLYENRTTASGFCSKCHPDKVSILSAASNAHQNIGCACHGYNPSATDLYNINAAHNLTKNIYCTDCHTDYDITTGNITIHGGDLVANNQSAHYLINSSNKNDTYERARSFFNNSRR